LHQLARVDALTGLINRRGLDEILAEECQRAKRDGQGFGLILLDVDHFKALNDSLGHQAGDRLLQWLTEQMRHCLRPYDHPGRWGGDEFMVVLAPSDPDTLEQIA
ncbi:GGDEF domain-containing protein, partial [Arthrospira platensis SPKY1]|nr:GGDEF domain-containing protein [Arthrospira platensis SPKY1]